jgi:hypothetical protein
VQPKDTSGKPDTSLKFALSTCTYAWAMAWYCAYLTDFNIKLFNWTVILLLGFEIAYIALQAGRGQLSHYNMSTPIKATSASICLSRYTFKT